MSLDEQTMAWVPSPGATWQNARTPLQLAEEQLSRSQPPAVQVSALKVLARRRCPITFKLDERVNNEDIERSAKAVTECLADNHWRVREAALRTIRVWGLQTMGESAVAEAVAKAEKMQQEEIKRNTPMRTYAEAHHQRRIRSAEANLKTLTLASKWAERGRMLARKKPDVVPSVDARGSGKTRKGGCGRTKEIYVICPKGRREGDDLTVITGGDDVTVKVPYGVMPGMEFTVVIDVPSIESIMLTKRISRRFRVISDAQRKRLRKLTVDMDNNGDGMLSCAELSAHLQTDRELLAMLKLCGHHNPDTILKSLGPRGMISIEKFLMMVSPKATLQQETEFAREERQTRLKLEEEARREEASVELAWSAAARSIRDGIAYEQAHARELQVVARLADIHPAVRAAAAECIKSLGLDVADFLPALGGQLTDSDWRVRASAAAAIAQTGRRGAGLVGSLLELLSDVDATTRAAAAEAVGRCHAPDGSSKYALRLQCSLQPLLTDPQWICREKSAIAVGALIKSFPLLAYNAACVREMACLLADYDSRVRCAAVSGLQLAGVISPGNSLRAAASRPFGGGRLREGIHAWRKLGWRAAGYVRRAMPDKLPELLSAPDEIKGADSEQRVNILNEQLLTTFLTVRREVLASLANLGIAAAAAAAAAARPVYAARLVSLLEQPASEHPVRDEEQEEPTGLSRVRTAARSAAISRARQSLFSSLDDNGDGVVTAAEIRLKLSEDTELQRLLMGILNKGADSENCDDERQRESWVNHTSQQWLAQGLPARFPPPQYPTKGIADKMADLAVVMGRGQFYCCPSNHPYYVDSCGFPVEQAKCIECAQPIGGKRCTPIKGNRPAAANVVESIASELGMPTQSCTRTVKGWQNNRTEARVPEEDELKKKTYVFDKTTGKYILEIDDAADGHANSDIRQSQESLRLIKSADESYSDYYSRLGVFLGTGLYCWHDAVGTGDNLQFQLKTIRSSCPPAEENLTPEPSAEELVTSSVKVAIPKTGGLTHSHRKAELEVLGTAMGSGRWYQCYKGHPYYVGGCGLPAVVVSCPDCKLSIGGDRYRLESTNRPMLLHNIQGIAHEIVTDSTAVRIDSPSYVEPPVSEVPPEDRMLQNILSKLDADGNRRIDLNEFLELFETDANQDDEELTVHAGLPAGLYVGVSKALGRFGASRHGGLLAVLCRNPILEVKQAASQALREIGAAGIPSATVGQLAAMLCDPGWRAAVSADWQIAGSLIETIGVLGSRAMAHNSALTQELKSARPGMPRGWETRALAATALGRRGPLLASDADATAALIQAVQSDASWHVRRAAVIALGRVGPALSHYAWVVQRLGERDETVRAVCMDVLKMMGVADPWVESKLLMQNLIKEVVDEELQSVVDGVLDGTRAAAMRLGVVDVLARRLKSGTTEQKWQGVQAVQRMGARAAEHAPLVAQLLTHADESLARAAIVALAAIGPKACDAVNAAGLDGAIVSGTEWETRAEAVQCVRAVVAVRVAQMRLESVGKTNISVDQLVSRWGSAVAPALADRHEEVRTLANRALGSLRVKPEAHVEQVITVFGHSDWRCRREACRVLGALGRRCSLAVDDTEFRKRMLELFKSIDRDGDMELSTAEIVTKLQQDFELHRLLAAIERTPEYVLGHLKERSGTIKLSDFLEIFKPADEAQRLGIAFQAATAVATHGLLDANVDVREAAKTALGSMGKETAIKVLMDRISTATDDEAKISSAEAMVAVLSSALLQKDGVAHPIRHDAQTAAELALKRAAGPLLDSPNWQVRAAGVASLGAAGALAQSFIGKLHALCDTIGTLRITGTPQLSNLDGEYFPSVPRDGKLNGPVTLWKRGGREGKREGGMLIYDGRMKPCPRWVLVRGFEALTETALEEALRGNTVHVGNLRGSFEEKESEVRAAMFEFGNVLGITIRNRRHMQKPSWALVTFASRDAADAAVPRAGEAIQARGPARSFWIAKVDAMQAAASTGGLRETMRTHIAKLEMQQSELDELGWSVQWSTRRNVRSADLCDWRGKIHTWSLSQQQGNPLGVSADGQLPADAPPRGRTGSKARRSVDLPVGTTGWRWTGYGREEVPVRIEHKCPNEQTNAVVNAARQAVVAIKQAVRKEETTLTTAATPSRAGNDRASAEDSAEPQPMARVEISSAEPAELEPALDRDQVEELLAPFGRDVDASLALASRSALSAWQEASRKKIILGRGTRQAESSSARGALQRAVHQVAVEGTVARSFQNWGSASTDVK